MRIVLLFEPSAGRAVPFAVGPEKYQSLAEELGRHANAPVQSVTGTLDQVAVGDFVLFAGGNVSRSLAACSPERAALLAPRIVLLDVSWQKALDLLEKHRLAGAVDSLRLSEWHARPSSCTGPYGVRCLTRSLGANCVPLAFFQSAHYCLMQSSVHRGMPDLLAKYLVAYERDLQPLSEVPSISLSRIVQNASDSPLTETASVKRVVSFMKRAREQAQWTQAQVAESAGIALEQVGQLEGSNFPQATLGSLRAYSLVMEPNWCWSMAELRDPAPVQVPTSQGTRYFAPAPGMRSEGGMTIYDLYQGGQRPSWESASMGNGSPRAEPYASV